MAALIGRGYRQGVDAAVGSVEGATDGQLLAATGTGPVGSSLSTGERKKAPRSNLGAFFDSGLGAPRALRT